MPSLTELLKPLEPELPEQEKPQDGLDDVGRDLMNALLGHFKPSFETAAPNATPKEE